MTNDDDNGDDGNDDEKNRLKYLSISNHHKNSIAKKKEKIMHYR